MGDRANIHVRERCGKETSNVFLYTHWSGSELPETLQRALNRGLSRWHDGPYLARIIFDEMIGHESGSLTGFGISSIVGDGDNRVLIVDVNAQTVSVDTGRTYSFEAYIDIPDISWDLLRSSG